MTDPTPDNPTPDPAPGSAGGCEAQKFRGMPAAEQLAAETISALIADGYTSSVLRELSRPKLNELGRRLVTPGQTVNDAAVEWLNEQGVHLPSSNVYRFAQRFREVYKRVWAGWADKLVMAEMARDPRFDQDGMARLIKNGVTRLLAQQVATANPEDLDTARLNSVLSFVSATDKGALEREKLLLAQREAEHKAAKAEAEIDRIRAEQRRKDARLDDAVKTLQARVDDLETRARKGQRIDPSIFAAIRDELTGLARPDDGDNDAAPATAAAAAGDAEGGAA